MSESLAVNFVNIGLSNNEKPHVTNLYHLSNNETLEGLRISCRYIDELHRDLIFPDKLRGADLISCMDAISNYTIEDENDVQKLICELIPAYFKIISKTNDSTKI